MPDCLKARTPEELAAVPRLTDDAIAWARKQGWHDANLARGISPGHNPAKCEVCRRRTGATSDPGTGVAPETRFGFTEEQLRSRLGLPPGRLSLGLPCGAPDGGGVILRVDVERTGAGCEGTGDR